MMTVTRKAFISVTVTLSLLLNYGVGAVLAIEQIVKVPVGTPVILETISEMNSKNITPGEKVMFKVSSDVIVDGKVIVKAGSGAIGQVTEAMGASYIGIPGVINISLQTVQAVDESLLPINATKGAKGESKLVMSVVISVVCCILFLLMKGKDAIIPMGTSVSAFVTAPTEVKIK